MANDCFVSRSKQYVLKGKKMMSYSPAKRLAVSDQLVLKLN